MEKHKGINTYIDVAMMECHVEKALIGKKKLSILVFKFNIDLSNSFYYKDIIKEIYQVCYYSTIFYLDKDRFAILLDNGLHDAIVMFRKIQRRVKNIFNQEIKYAGITELSKADTYSSFIKRALKFLKLSARNPKNIIIYGTDEFKFYNEKENKNAIEAILKEDSEILICNICDGTIVKEKGKIITYSLESTEILTSKKEILYLYHYEKYVYLQHKGIPYTIKADILKIDKKANKIWVNNYLFLETSPIDRKVDRLERSVQKQQVIILQNNKVVITSTMLSLSSESIAIKLDKNRVKQLSERQSKKYTVKFKIFNLGFNKIKETQVSTVEVKSTLFSISKSEDKGVFVFAKNSPDKSRIEAHIDYVRQVK